MLWDTVGWKAWGNGKDSNAWGTGVYIQRCFLRSLSSIHDISIHIQNRSEAP